MSNVDEEILKIELAMAVGVFVNKFPVGTLTDRQYYDLVDFIKNYKGGDDE